MTAATRPARLSGPHWAITALPTDRAPLPEKGRSSARGRHSAGIPTASSTGPRKAESRSMAPLARTMVIATSMVSTAGKMPAHTLSPAFMPQVRAS